MSGDILILLLATVAWLFLSLKNCYKKFAIIIFFSAFIPLILLNHVADTYLVAISSLPFVSFLIILDKVRGSAIINHDSKLSSAYISITGIILAIIGIASIIIFATTGLLTESIEKYPYAIYQELLAILTSALMAILIFCVPLKVILTYTSGKLKTKWYLLLSDASGERLMNKQLAICLSICIILGIVVAFVPHLSAINPNNERLGVDSIRYADLLRQVRNQVTNPVYYIFTTSTDRPLTLTVLFFITYASGGDPFHVVEFSPIFLAPLLILVTFLLTRETTGNDKISLLSAFLTAISFQTLVGIYSGFYANWFALILGYLALGICVRYLKRPSKFNIVILAVVITAVLLGHLYTWTIIISIAFVFLAVLYAVNYYPRKHIIILYLVLSSSIAVDVLKSLMTDSSTGLEADVSLGRQGLGIGQFSERLKTLTDTVQIYYGGIYANIAILGLGLYWLIRCNPKDLVSIFLLIFMSSAIIPLFIGDWVLQSRVLYEIPFQIPAAIGLFSIWKDNQKLIFISIILVAAYLSFHVLVNLGLNYSVVG